MTRRSLSRGFTYWPSADNVARANFLFQSRWCRFHPEWPWYQPTENDPFDSTSIVTDVMLALEGGQYVMLGWMGVPDWVNPNANGIEDGGYHRFPVDVPGRLKRAAALAQLLDELVVAMEAANIPLSHVMVEIDNESNAVGDFNMDGQSAATVAASMADCAYVAYDRGFVPVFGGLAAYGDLNSSDPNETMWQPHNWTEAMLDAEPRLEDLVALGARFACHAYHFEGGSQTQYGNDPADSLGWNGWQQLNAMWLMLKDRGLTDAQARIIVNEYGSPSDFGAGFTYDWQDEHGRKDEEVILWRQAFGQIDSECCIKHALIDDTPSADPSIYESWGVLDSNGSPKPIVATLNEFWSVDPAAPTDPDDPTDPDVPTIPTDDPTTILAGPLVILQPNAWGRHMGISLPPDELDARAIRALGMKHVRLEVTQGDGFDSLAAAITEARRRSLKITVAYTPATDPTTWTVSEQGDYLDELVTIAGHQAHRIEIAPGILDDGASSREWMAQTVAAARGHLSDYPRIQLVTGMAPQNETGDAPHVAVTDLLENHKDLLRTLDSFSIGIYDASTSATFDASALPQRNPLYFVPALRVTMRVEGLRRRVDLGGLTNTTSAASAAASFNSYMTEIAHQVREHAVKIGVVWWHGLIDDGTNYAPYSESGGPNSDFVNTVMAWAQHDYPGR